MFSVVIPVYNAEKYLPRCLDSILKQTFVDYEICCINDGSTDGSKDILKEYAKEDARIHIINTEHKGVSYVRNLGIRKMQGDYLCFVDADDWIDQNLLETCCTHIVREHADFYVLDFFRCRKDFSIYRVPGQNRKEGILEKGDVKELSEYMKNNMVVWNKIFSRRFLAENKIRFEDLFQGEDTIFTMSTYTLANKIYYINYAGYYYFENEKSIVHTYTKERISLPIKMRNAMLTLKKYYDEDEYIKYVNTKIIMGVLDIYFRYFNHPENKKSFREKKKEFYALIKKSPFSEAFSFYEYNYLSVIGKIMLLTGKPSFFRLSLAVWLKEVTGYKR